MEQMKLWDNNLCPCCRQVPERSTTHLFLCPHPSIEELRNTSFHNILDWLHEIDTDPLLLHILSSFWHGEDVHFDTDHPPLLKHIYNTMRDIGLHQMWGGDLFPLIWSTFNMNIIKISATNAQEKNGPLCL